MQAQAVQFEFVVFLRLLDPEVTGTKTPRNAGNCPLNDTVSYFKTDSFTFWIHIIKPYQQIGLKFEEETSEVLRLERSSVWC